MMMIMTTKETVKKKHVPHYLDAKFTARMALHVTRGRGQDESDEWLVKLHEEEEEIMFSELIYSFFFLFLSHLLSAVCLLLLPSPPLMEEEVSDP